MPFNIISPVSWNKKPDNRPNWIIEDTASFVENPKYNPYTAIRNASRSLRKINISLTKESNNYPDYKVQDFWVYLIKSRNSTPAKILNPIYLK